MRSDNRRRITLLLLAATALVLQFVLDETRTPTRQWDYDLKLEAAQKAERAFAAVRDHRGLEGASVDLVNDPAGTGLIGPEFSLITNATGDLDAKLTSLNPNFAAVLVGYFREAGLQPGDPVAVAVSGSFPGLNICLYAAVETMELRPVVITSVGASNWGANSPEFTWLDMETLFHDRGIFTTRSRAATYGGGNDMGRGMSPAGREALQASIDRNGVPFLTSRNIEDAIDLRMDLFGKESGGRPYKLYVNVGGGVASVGNRYTKTLLPEGLSFQLKPHNWPLKGNLILFAEKGVPVVHLLRVINLARKHGLPLAPDFQPQPGQGEIFVREMYRWPLAAAFLVIYCLACVLILAPQVRRGLFDKLSRPSATAPLLVAVFLGLASTPDAEAARWKAVDPQEKGDTVCLEIDGRPFEYLTLAGDRPLEVTIDGPRRVKLIGRYLFARDEEGTREMVIDVALDGDPVISRSFHVQPLDAVTPCSGEGDVSSLHRVYVDVPKGRHTLYITGTTDGDGEVACRVFRRSRSRKTKRVAFTPTGYSEVATLQFESGTQSTYHRFDAGAPLTFSVAGPTDLKIYTRLDFAPGVLGSRKYMLEVWCDGELHRTYHFDTTRLANAFYPDDLHLLPGSRRTLNLRVDEGRHDFEIRCVRPGDCGVAAQIRIPKKDLRGAP